MDDVELERLVVGCREEATRLADHCFTRPIGVAEFKDVGSAWSVISLAKWGNGAGGWEAIGKLRPTLDRNYGAQMNLCQLEARQIALCVSDPDREADLRTLATKQGFSLRKRTTDDGSYQLVDPYFNAILAGERCDLTRDDVEAWLTETPAEAQG